MVRHMREIAYQSDKVMIIHYVAPGRVYLWTWIYFKSEKEVTKTKYEIIYGSISLVS